MSVADDIIEAYRLLFGGAEQVPAHCRTSLHVRSIKWMVAAPAMHEPITEAITTARMNSHLPIGRILLTSPRKSVLLFAHATAHEDAKHNVVSESEKPSREDQETGAGQNEIGVDAPGQTGMDFAVHQDVTEEADNAQPSDKTDAGADDAAEQEVSHVMARPLV